MFDLNRVQIGLGSIGAGIAIMFGNLPAVVWLLLGAQLIDFVSGVLVAGREQQIDSHTGWLGLRKKAMTWCLVAVGALGEVALNRPAPIVEFVCGFYLAVECLSVIENAGALGVPVPDILKQAIAKLRSPEPPRPGTVS